MRFSMRIIVILIAFSLFTNFSFKRIDYRDGINNNVCKTLKGDVMVYFVFVDTKTTAPWTEFDIKSTLDSMNVAVKWLESQARLNNIKINIRTDYYIGSEQTTIRKNLEYGTIEETVSKPNYKKGLASLNKWADGIAARVGKDVQINTNEGIPEIKNPRNKERLVAHLRDVEETESVALLYLVNNYYRNDISITVNQLNTDDVEFGIVSYKYPSVLAQNILSLFGAADLSESIYRKNAKNINYAKNTFPNDVMQDVYGTSIKSLEIGEYTQYLIGWQSTLNPKHEALLTDRISNF